MSQSDLYLKALGAAIFEAVSSALCFACLYSGFHRRAQRQFPRQGALQCEMQNILNTEMSKAATVTIAANATSPRLAQK